MMCRAIIVIFSRKIQSFIRKLDSSPLTTICIILFLSGLAGCSMHCIAIVMIIRRATMGDIGFNFKCRIKIKIECGEQQKTGNAGWKTSLQRNELNEGKPKQPEEEEIKNLTIWGDFANSKCEFLSQFSPSPLEGALHSSCHHPRP